jgi:hypothetical protein
MIVVTAGPAAMEGSGMSIGAAGTSGPFGVEGVDGREDASGAGGAATPDASGAGAAGASARPRSVDMNGLGLREQLEARLAAAGNPGGTTAPAVPPATTLPAEPRREPLGGWKVSASFGPRFERYEPVDVRIKNDRLDVSIEGVQFLQRNSMEYYKFWEAEKVGDVLRWVDEPTNQTLVEAKKADWIVGIQAYHPKMLVSLGGDGKKNLNTSVHTTGTIEGQPIDADIDLKDKFGAIHLTHKLMNYEVYGGKSMTLAQGKAGKLTLDTKAGLGIYTGRVRVNYRDPKDYWNFISYDEPRSKVIGGEVTLKNSLTYMLSGGRLGFGAEVDITRGKMSYDMMGGKTSHDVKSESFAVFVKMNF